MLTAHDIANKRLTFLAVLRMISLIGPFFGIVALLSWLFEGFMDGDFFDLSYYSGRILTAVLGFGTPAVAWVFGPRISRWLVPATGANNCPKCGQPATESHERCTECGLLIGRHAR